MPEKWRKRQRKVGKSIFVCSLLPLLPPPPEQLMLFCLFALNLCTRCKCHCKCLFRAIPGNILPSSVCPTPSIQLWSAAEPSDSRRQRCGEISIIPVHDEMHIVLCQMQVTHLWGPWESTSVRRTFHSNVCCPKWWESFCLPFVRSFIAFLPSFAFLHLHGANEAGVNNTRLGVENFVCSHQNGRPIFRVSNSMQILICY